MLTPLRLKCLIEGEDIVFPVTAGDNEVSDLKEFIQSKRALDSLKDVGPHTLELWKPKDTNPIASKPRNDLVERIGLLGDISKFADELDPSETVLSLFPIQPPREHIHIIVKVPRTNHFRAIHEHFWQRREHISVRWRVQIPESSLSELDDNSETLELVVIDLPRGSEKAFTTEVPRLLVVPIYETFWDVLKDEDQRWQALLQPPRFSHPCHATIVTGQPGVGKSVFLIYVLLRRLANGMTTVYCDRGAYVHIFDDTGVRRLTLSDGSRIPELDNNSECCALVNLGDKLKLVPDVFYPQLRKGRVVVATSPSKEHWRSFSHEHLARVCCMPTWEWGPLYFASLLYAHKDLNTFDLDHCETLQSTYSVFRGIPRFCFWSLNPIVLRMQKAEIKNALDSITFLDDFAHAISGQLPFNPNTSHRLVRVEPVDNEWLMTRTEIKSNHIAELIFERIRILTKARFLEKLMEYLAYPNAHGPAGILFEQAAHYSIRKGLTLTIAPLPSGTTLDVSIPGIPVEKNEKSRYYSLSNREKAGSRNVHPDFLDLYMTPKSKIEPSIDALFISSKHITYPFQMTVSPRHPINFRGLDTVFKHLPATAQKDVRFVFIIPAKGPSGEEYEGIQTVQSIDTPQNADADRVKKFKQLPHSFRDYHDLMVENR
ncbi:hypothetical protein M378DRAFT_21547 [Amanita muscaria Koide BX008]|uniref:Crinkler effector protein N-terminal domain-containing protein n=1 Tax=Amanita muscaria (strain Koide BX008) TaxID=946122 RepID=A0A0C2XJX2_AMAMK|nr:hypothetical protein M378DRAFT_21547 [Amanita muscaria Koide BX008]